MIVNYDSGNMGYFHVRFDSSVVIYDQRAFLRLTTGIVVNPKFH